MGKKIEGPSRSFEGYNGVWDFAQIKLGGRCLPAPPPPIALPCAVAVSVRLCYLVRASCIFIISLALEPIKSQRCWYKISRYNFSVYLRNTAITDLSEISMESSTVSLYVLGKCSNEMVALHLLTRAQLLPRMAARTRAVKTTLFTSALRRIFSNR